MTFELPKRDYPYEALEPYIDARTMEIHHTKHHQGYVNKTNAALENYPDLQSKSVEDLLSDLSSLPEENLAKTVDWFSYLTRLLRRQGVMVKHLAPELFTVYWHQGIIYQALQWWFAQIRQLRLFPGHNIKYLG